MIRRFLLPTAIAAALAVAGPAAASPPEGKGKPEHAGKPDKADKGPDKGKPAKVTGTGAPDLGDAVAAAVLGELERQLIGDYFRSTPPSALPPGLAKQGKVPPGIARQIQRGQRLPDDVQMLPLPADLLGRLPSYRGARPVVVGSDVVLVQEGTRLILDILKDVL
ncbi:hypothetical protein [Caenispirillum bisanense]|uniref:Nickel/cobalt transporter regulator n=1 Tax=Caenispirillum bisanense TaxID=414052 RepID=A0A286GVE9_9PROT|nr:hypothetical protein [Caenispirillum bisanense]SOD98984.1 Protein of unknown function [Caenispirillum bisanense]